MFSVFDGKETVLIVKSNTWQSCRDDALLMVHGIASLEQYYKQKIDKNDLNLRKSLKTFQKCTVRKCVKLNFAYQTMSYFPSELKKGSRREFIWVRKNKNGYFVT